MDNNNSDNGWWSTVHSIFVRSFIEVIAYRVHVLLHKTGHTTIIFTYAQGLIMQSVVRE